MCIQHIQIREMMQSMAVALLLLLGVALPAGAQDGVVLINQERALAGNVTPGDAPGFPVTLSERGSYRLSGNLTVPDANTTAIEITVSSITLDLNGFGIFGPTNCDVGSAGAIICSPTGSGDGVFAIGVRAITVVNGNVRGMGHIGLNLGEGSFVDRVTVRHSGASGIIVLQSSTVVNSIAILNGGVGIFAGAGSTVTTNTANQNRTQGIFAENGSTVSDNTASSNGEEGILASSGSTVLGNTTRNNKGAGIFTVSECTVSTNTSHLNSGTGIIAGVGSVVHDNTATLNELAGISVGGDSTVSGNTARNNKLDGILAGDAGGSTIRGNTAGDNGGDGISTLRSAVLENTATGNQGFGLRLGTESGYANNVLNLNGAGDVSGGIQIGLNLCGTALCP